MLDNSSYFIIQFSSITESFIRISPKPFIKSETEAPLLNVSTERVTGNPVYLCPVCPLEAESLFFFRLHLAIHPEFSRTAEVVHRDLEHNCGFCSFVGKNEGEFSSHAVVHMSDRRYQCIYCNYDAFKKKDVQSHCKNLHEEEAVFDKLTKTVVNGMDWMSIVNLNPKVALGNNKNVRSKKQYKRLIINSDSDTSDSDNESDAIPVLDRVESQGFTVTDSKQLSQDLSPDVLDKEGEKIEINNVEDEEDKDLIVEMDTDERDEMSREQDTNLREHESDKEKISENSSAEFHLDCPEKSAKIENTHDKETFKDSADGTKDRNLNNTTKEIATREILTTNKNIDTPKVMSQASNSQKNIERESEIENTKRSSDVACLESKIIDKSESATDSGATDSGDVMNATEENASNLYCTIADKNVKAKETEEDMDFDTLIKSIDDAVNDSSSFTDNKNTEEVMEVN